jgi:hypothetical protein
VGGGLDLGQAAAMAQKETEMDLQEKIREGVIEELRRQAENSNDQLKFEVREEVVVINGPVNLDDMIMVITGSLAGGP